MFARGKSWQEFSGYTINSQRLPCSIDLWTSVLSIYVFPQERAIELHYLIFDIDIWHQWCCITSQLRSLLTRGFGEDGQY